MTPYIVDASVGIKWLLPESGTRDALRVRSSGNPLHVPSFFDLELTSAFSSTLDIPVIASGGVGNLDHLADGVTIGRADAVLAASIFHFGEYTVRQAKERMAQRGIEVRL